MYFFAGHASELLYYLKNNTTPSMIEHGFTHMNADM